ncbi:MAG: DUF748 domain-containing protein [Desulforegulaceae bacterium]|nr:DUF748 domain-containing protein [Desulforegulaceae bacterium]
MTRKNKSAIILGSIFVFYAVLGFIIIPLTAKYMAPKKIKEIINRDVEIEKIRFNPFAFSLKIEKFKIYTKDKENIFAGFDKFYVNIGFLSSIFKLSPVISEIYLNSPEFYVEKGKNNQFNFSDLIPPKKEEVEKAEKKQNDKNFGFLATDLKIDNAGLIFVDKPFNTTHKIEKLNLSIPFISGFEKDKEVPVHIYLSGRANGADINLDLVSRPFLTNLKSSANLKINNISIPFYYSYMKNSVNFLTKSGTLNIDMKALFEKAANNNNLEAEAKLSLDNFLINDEKSEKIASLNKISIETNKIYPLKNIYSIKNILIDSPQFKIERKNQEINILNLVKQNNSKKEEKTPNKKDEKKEDSSDFLVGIDEIFIKNGNISFSDYDAPLVLAKVYDSPVKNTISELNLKIDKFSTQKNKSSDFDLKFSLNEKTDFNFNGNFGINPVFAKINSEIDNLYFDYANGYIPSNLKISIKNGNADLKSKTELKIENNELKLSAAADLFVNEIKIIERETKKDFFKLDKFEIFKLNFNLLPMSLDIENILIAGINQKILKDKNGRFNFQNVFPENNEKDKKELEKEIKESNKEKSELFPISISNITLKEIGADYTDFTLKPYFSTNFIINSADIKNLSTTAFEGADLTLNGKLDNTAPLRANGKLNPLLEDLLVDLKIDLKSLNLTHFTPYSGKFIGKAIQKGQLNLDLDYDIKNRKIDAQNKVLLDQFEFGRDIESEDAVNVPVGLAVSLLKDREGEINLDIPVSGSFDDPKFKVSKVIVQVLKNIVVKAASSPFSLVASLAGGGDEMKYIEFLEGSTEFSEDSINRLQAIEKILFERPGLKIDLKGYCDLQKDTAGLKEDKFNLLVNNKRTQLGFDSDIDSKEYLKILEKIHLEIFDKKFEFELEDKEKIDLISEKIKSSIKITDEDLRYLASKRADTVKEYILKAGRVDTSRIFVNETDKISPLEVKGISALRVDLDLK